MEEKPEGTPNPLNPDIAASLDANPSEPMRSEKTSDSTHPADLALPVDMGDGPTPPATAKPAAPASVKRPASQPRPARPIDMVRPRRARPMRAAAPAAATVYVDAAKPDISADPMTPLSVLQAGTPPQVPQPEAPSSAPQPEAQPLQPEPGIHESQADAAPSVDITPQAPQPTDPAAALGVVTNLDGTVSDAINPHDRPMRKAPTVDTPKPRKRRRNMRLIVAMVVCLFVAVGCAVAAVLVLVNGGKTDPVSAATSRLLSGEAPDNIMIDGKIDIDVTDRSSLFSRVGVTVSTEIAPKTLINSTIARIDAKLRDGGSLELELGEIYAAGNDVYIRLDGVGELLDAYGVPAATSPNETTETTETTETAETAKTTNGDPAVAEDIVSIEENCTADENCIVTTTESETVDSLRATLDNLNLMEGDWIRIPLEDLSTALPSDAMEQNALLCSVGLLVDFSKSRNTVSELYNRYPFAGSTDEDLAIDSLRDHLYLVEIDDDRYARFIDGLEGSSVLNNWTTCMGGRTSGTLPDAQDWPEVYVEVNDNHNFTRLYFTQSLAGGEVTADLTFSYPINISVPEPTEYTDFSELMQKTAKDLFEE